MDKTKARLLKKKPTTCDYRNPNPPSSSSPNAYESFCEFTFRFFLCLVIFFFIIIQDICVKKYNTMPMRDDDDPVKDLEKFVEMQCMEIKSIVNKDRGSNLYQQMLKVQSNVEAKRQKISHEDYMKLVQYVPHLINDFFVAANYVDVLKMLDTCKYDMGMKIFDDDKSQLVEDHEVLVYVTNKE